jgi:4-hydroxybenzoate polyprenyltransferase
VKHFGEYLQERFPLQVNGLLIVSCFSANYMLASAAVAPQEPIRLGWRFAAGCVALLLMFFHMRVIDEHKDYEQDRIVHPQRVLSRGLVTLGLLGRLGLIGVALELVLSAMLGIPALIACLALLGISWLIYNEFFAGAWLGRHLLVNALVHLVVMPAYSLYAFSAATQRHPWTAPAPVLLYAWVSYCVGFAYELARKTRAPSDERAGLITYSAVMGPHAPAGLALLALVVAGGISVAVGLLLRFETWYHASVGGLLLIVTLGIARYRWDTRRATAAQLQVLAGLFIFAFDVLAAAQLIRLHGVTWA